MEIKEILDRVIEDYRKITGLRSYMVLSKDDLNSASEKNYFCKCLKTSSKAVKLCEQCAVEALDIIAEKKNAYSYSCHAGVIKVAVPVLVDSQMKAAIVVEGILNRKQLEESDKWTEYLNQEYNVSPSIVKNTFEAITVLNEKELAASIQLLKDLINYHFSKETA